MLKFTSLLKKLVQGLKLLIGMEKYVIWIKTKRCSKIKYNPSTKYLMQRFHKIHQYSYFYEKNKKYHSTFHRIDDRIYEFFISETTAPNIYRS